MRRISFLDWLYPPKCMVCDNIININEEKWLCPCCRDILAYIEGEVCPKCGRPHADNGICGECAGRALYFECNYSVFIYDDVMRLLIHKFKYGRHPGYGRGLGGLMAGKIKRDVFKEIDFIVPVPMYYKKQRKRGYNQAKLLAGELSRNYKKPMYAGMLVRTRETKAQASLSPRARENNVAGAFTVYDPKKAAQKNILLVDDIFTTGSTLSECAKVLLAAGAGRVVCVTLAAVMKKET